MLKKLTATILTLCLVLNLCIVTAQTKKAELNLENVSTLCGLGIIPSDIKANKTVSRGDFAIWFSNFYTDDIKEYPTVQTSFTDVPEKYKKAVAILENLKLVDGNEEKFNTRRPIEFDQAVKIIVTALGYDFLAKEKGGYPNGYIKVATEINLLNNVNGAAGEKLKSHEVVNLLYNCLDIGILEQTVFGEKDEYDVKNDATLLSKYRDIYVHKGIFDGTCDTTLIGNSSLKDNHIMIGNIEFISTNSNIADALGQSVKAYYKANNDGTKSIVYLDLIKNNVLLLKDEEILEVNENCDTITYQADNNKMKDIKLSPILRVVYNGVAFSEYTAEDFKVKNGQLRLIDNNQDNVYDVVFIHKYENLVVSYKSIFSQTITGKYSYADSLSSIDLTPTDDTKVKITKNDIEATINDINEYDVLSVAKSKTGSKEIIDITVSDKFVEGVISEINQNGKKVLIDGVYHELSQVYIEALEKADSAATKIVLGESYKCFKDDGGKIVFIKQAGSSETKYMYLYKISKETGLESKIAARLLTQNEEWVTLDFAPKMRLNQAETKVAKEKVYDALVKDGACVRQIIKVKTNDEKEIVEVEIAEVTDENKKESFTVTTPRTNYYKYQNESFDSAMFVTNNTSVFVIPDGIEDTEENHSVRKKDILRGDHIYQNYQAYDIDEYNFTNVLMIKQTPAEVAEDGQNRSIFIVNEVADVIYNDENRYKISGSMGSYRNISIVAESGVDLSELRCGDIVFVNMNQKGNLTSYTPLYKVLDGEVMQNKQVNGNVSIASGVVKNVDPVGGRMKILSPNAQVMRLDNNVAVTVYKVGDKEISHGTIKDIEIGDFVFARLVIQSLRELVIIRFN
ncbi:MAG: hypothetical protein RSA27_01785 [Oscillospiraceae bacterium]